MSKKSTVWWWHIHHDVLLEGQLETLAVRHNYIARQKPAYQLDTRKRWMVPVKNPARIPQEVKDVWAKYEELYHAAKEARRNRNNSATARLIFKSTWARRMGALRRYVATVHKHREELETLHASELRSCPWDGEQLVFPPAPSTVPTKIASLYRHAKP